MPSITVSNLAPGTTTTEVSDFFAFCGKVNNVTLESGTLEDTALVEFNQLSAVKTALLLSESELKGRKITVITDSQTASKLEDLGHDVTSESRADSNNDDVPQELKPKAQVVAEYLSSGYVLGDKVIDRALELDTKHGISSGFTSFLTGLNDKYHLTEKAETADEKVGLSTTFSKYFDKALKTPTGSYIRSFYTDAAKTAADVHAEARRLADLKSGDSKKITSSSPPTAEKL
ncbi:hypothetical protein NADFUDRAFT_81682 [Nadsonia fulvescens var. elongata DSM 6958]|uniref:RRM domain-containing protein n=1 Tax=Nadsonia fulvescens var. elongata DSM 6958 TaxID=857566 RepID=A0A1E3PNS9_9ASCO|nr:hypothetical protein NADFUDRAFT_81682 [Nadsonia fulvescens var. elongata DSM 6958]